MIKEQPQIDLKEFADSPYWRPIKNVILGEIEYYREKYEAVELDRDKALSLVSKIQALKSLIRKISGTAEEVLELKDEYN